MSGAQGKFTRKAGRACPPFFCISGFHYRLLLFTPLPVSHVLKHHTFASGLQSI